METIHAVTGRLDDDKNNGSQKFQELQYFRRTLNKQYECLFGRDDADGWDVRQAMNDLMGYDSVPEPRIIIAALHACRRLNDYALAVRFLEAVKHKCGHDVEKIYPYIVQEVGITVAELGCDFPESLGYDKPELWMESVFDM